MNASVGDLKYKDSGSRLCKSNRLHFRRVLAQRLSGREEEGSVRARSTVTYLQR